MTCKNERMVCEARESALSTKQWRGSRRCTDARGRGENKARKKLSAVKSGRAKIRM